MASARRHQRLGLRQTVRGLQQLSQVVEANGDRRVFGSVGLFVDGQRAAHQRLGLGQTVSCPSATEPGC